LTDRFSDPAERLAALNAISAELEKLAVNPRLGIGYPGGPFEHRRIYRFVINVGGGERYVQVAYAVFPKNKSVVVSGFVPVIF